MRRFVCLIACVATLVYPAAGFAGEISFHLPLSYWNMASCSSPGKDTQAHCRWQLNSQGGFGISCKVEAMGDARTQEISLDIDVRQTSARAVDRAAGLRKFSYDYSGIGCWAYVPSGMDNLACRVRRNGFNCTWCTGYYCYEGQANLSERTVEESRTRDSGFALRATEEPSLWD